MKWSVLAGIVAVTCACGGGRSTNTDPERGPSAARANPAAVEPNASGSRVPNNAANSAANQQVTLIGCLQGPPAGADTTGTSGTRDGSPAGRAATGGDSMGSAYRLVDAAAESHDSAGIGANGAGASGGPLVSGRSSYVLDAIPDGARGDVNRQVRVVGRLDVTLAPAPNGMVGGGSASDVSGKNASGVATGTRRIRVERIEVVAPSCSSR